MQALVDFRGFRLIAMPWLPLKEKIYGSSDGGKSLNLNNETFNDIMTKAASFLHLNGHYVSNKFIYSAGDVEGYCLINILI